MEKNYEHRDQMQEFCVLPGFFQHAVLKTHLQFQRGIFADNIEYLLREIPAKKRVLSIHCHFQPVW